MKAAVVYHFFPHYRAGVLRELLRSPAHEYLLVADETARDAGIPAWDLAQCPRFLRAPCRSFKSFLLQRGLVRLGLRRDLHALVYLGNPYFLSTWVSAALARLTGKRVLFWTHGWTRRERGLKAWVRTAFYRLAHGLLLYGHSAKAAGIARGFAPESLHVVYNSLDYETQKRIRAALPRERLARLPWELFGNDQPIVVCSARLTASCRFDLLLQAQARLQAQGHPVSVLLIGDGPERPALQALAARLQVPVKFFGACYDEEILAQLIMSAHVTVSPGKVGLTALHSLAFGTPVITHDDGDAQGPEWEAIIPGRTGELFRRGDVEDLSRAIRTWTSRPAKAPGVAEACFELLEKFYNPVFQRHAIDRAVSGAPADDGRWRQENLGHA